MDSCHPSNLVDSTQSGPINLFVASPNEPSLHSIDLQTIPPSPPVFLFHRHYMQLFLWLSYVPLAVFQSVPTALCLTSFFGSHISSIPQEARSYWSLLWHKSSQPFTRMLYSFCNVLFNVWQVASEPSLLPVATLHCGGYGNFIKIEWAPFFRQLASLLL